MARVLAVSSQVVRGHVGLSAAVPALQRLGHEVWPVPTIVLSNHPGHPHAAGTEIEPGVLDAMLDALDRNGWLGEVDAVLTGYLPSAEHVAFAARLLERLRARQRVLYLCDPVLGDEPGGLYLDSGAAAALRAGLLPLADFVTPNLFELGWLSRRPVRSRAEIEEAARRSSPHAAVLVTSVPAAAGRLANVLLMPDGAASCEVERRPKVPHGTGDLLAALFLGHLLRGESDPAALGRAAAGVELAIAASAGRDELSLASLPADWASAHTSKVDVEA